MAVRPSSEAHRRAVKKYNKENAKTFAVTLFYHSEGDIIEKLESVDNKRAYLMYLIRKDIAECERIEREAEGE